MAMDAASGWGLDELEDGREAPFANPLENVIRNREVCKYAGFWIWILILKNLVKKK